jgi:uncharacterized repeat protein (TIGR01451 family)
MGSQAVEFEITDPAYMPAFYADPGTGVIPFSGWSYFWQTDEGAISHAEKPVFYFNNSGSHTVTVILVPRKKEDDIGIVQDVHTFTLIASQTSGNSNGEIFNDPIYFLTPPRVGDNAYAIVPLNSCDIMSVPHLNSVSFDDTKLTFVKLLDVNNFGSPSLASEFDVAMGLTTNKKVKFTVNWAPIGVRSDVAAVLEFEVIAQPGDQISIKHTPDQLFPNQCKPISEELEMSFIGPYDPNYKESSVHEINVNKVDTSILNSTSVEYTIHFQNIGNGPVDSITIVDSLPNYLILENYVSSSLSADKVNFSSVGNVLTWKLAPNADIKGTNESPSQPQYKTKGWVKFKAMISPEQDITYDTCYCLCNKATIYFDSLAPIATKADVIAIGDRLCFDFVGGNDKNPTYAEQMCNDSAVYYGNKTAGISEVWRPSKFSEITVYPNPTSGKITFESDLKGEVKIVVFNSLGQMVKEARSITNTIDLIELPRGSYSVMLTDQDKKYYTRVIRY